MTKSVGFPTNYVLIDFENVQPKNLNLLKEKHFKIYLFLGAKQPRIDVPLAMDMLALGPERAKYIPVSKTADNALDFHMTYYLGQLVSRDPKGHFHLITKDKGADPLIDHLKSKNIKICRRASLSDIPILNSRNNTIEDEKFVALVKNLSCRGQSKPGTEKTLKNTIKNTFKDKLKDKEVAALFRKLSDKKYITSRNNKIFYALPS